jgi:hypothetical protein
MKKEEAILVDYYQSGYGPTIRIDVFTVKNLEYLKSKFMSLSENVGSKVDFLTQDNILPTNIDKFILKSVNDSSDKEIIFSNDDEKAVTCEWILNSYEWRRTAGLVQGLIDNSENPCHQYLTSEDSDAVVVELAFKEKYIL